MQKIRNWALVLVSIDERGGFRISPRGEIGSRAEWESNQPKRLGKGSIAKWEAFEEKPDIRQVQQMRIALSELTGPLLMERQLGPVLLHAVSQSHPQLGLLLQGEALPSLLDVG